ncbi:GDSL-type esterase/lipase family protein [Micromonospora carbonacea]|uniref:SGNH/GDSL hydrolase family protein n=1 Tax=Micromonospora carbonacea TaxID=47853 RepID=A0A7H8XK50_9ACTN|nr:MULTISPECIES: GDSL-type esterase/lipase family protein [Micromonospora]MBB5827538.1 lysophospholipase L1-like esterase [Micromonospora carbonacea]QLD24709.1 SGNH/GDSL hydrolase family protein [Micromonospora carbonacea]WFE61078.1 GDSL-type esterase/lipase family protein [Micromonospora sp. WMMD712]
MPRRWVAAVACLLALVALACEGGGEAGPRPSGGSPAPGTPAVMAALGDSISTGFGSCLMLSSCERNSWSTGDGLRVDSHYQRLLDRNSKLRGAAHNHAKPGARAAALAGQAEAAVRDRADYVTVLIGANDACRDDVAAMTPAATFRKQVDEGLRVLRTGRPKARVLVVSVPDLYRLWEVGHTDSRAVRAWGHGVCPALLANATSTAPADAARRAKVRDRIDAYNAQLKSACRAYGSRCRYDGGAVHRVRFTLDLVNALDWFHPNVAGQDRLADATWGAAGFD